MLNKIFKIIKNKKDNRIQLENVNGIKRRKYKNYEDYLNHQSEKLKKNYDIIHLSDQEYEEIVFNRYKKTDLIFKNKTLICLAARLGGEVRAFKRLGALAVGIDLNPGVNNKDVLVGDFHNIQFPNESFDYVFTNSIDHVYDLDKFLKEVYRILKYDGKFIIELGEVKIKDKSFEVIDTTNPSHLVTKFTSFFVLKETKEIVNKTNYINWYGNLILLVKK